MKVIAMKFRIYFLSFSVIIQSGKQASQTQNNGWYKFSENSYVPWYDDVDDDAIAASSTVTEGYSNWIRVNKTSTRFPFYCITKQI